MTRYLLATWEGGGVVPPQMALARRLIARGHAVRVLADPSVEASARAAGCEFSSWKRAPHKSSLAAEDDLLRDWEYKNLFKLFARLLDTFLCGPAAKFAADTIEVLDDHPADVVLADAMLFGVFMAAESAKLPCSALVPNIYMRPTKGVPPIGPGFMPARGPIGWIRDRLVSAMSSRMWRRGLPPINQARTELGLPAVDSIWAQYDRLEQVLVMTSPTFDFTATELPSNTRYVGPMLDDPSWADAPWTAPWPASNHDPLVLVGLSSTFQDQIGVLERITSALAGMPVRALVTLGPALKPDAVRSPSPNVAIVGTAPHGLVLPHAKLVITHCGHGTTLRALAAGVPVVCMPMGRDQNDTAARVVARGAGLRIKPSSSIVTIRRAVEKVLREPRYTAGAQVLMAAISREAAATDLIAIVEELDPPAARVTAAS